MRARRPPEPVIDFGCLGVGDPACDAIPAWTYFSTERRTVDTNTFNIS
jgi:aminoglycoside phosphotransferase (APT) family kinase protein